MGELGIKIWECVSESSAFKCPITGMCMSDPVVAADDRTYERPYIEQWLKAEAQKPSSHLRPDHFKLVANEELKNKIDTWKAQQSDTELHGALLREHVTNVTWAKGPVEAVAALEVLLKFVKEKSAVVPRSQLGRLRGCLKSDQKIWCEKVSGALGAVEVAAQSMTASLGQRLQTAKISSWRAGQAKEMSILAAQQLNAQIQGAEKMVLTLKCKLQELNTKCANATRIEGLYNVEVEKVAKMLGGCEQKSLLCSLTFNSRAVTTMPHRLVDRLHSDDNLKSKDPEQTQQPQKRQRVAAPVSNTVGNEDKESCTLMRGPETNRGGICRTRQAARLSKNCSSPLDVRIKRMECPRS